MKITRRLFAFLAFISTMAILALAGAAGRPATSHSFLAFVGTYTSKTDSKGIYAYEFDAETGKLSLKGLAAATTDPSFVVIHPNGKYAYAANEAGKQSTLTAFSVDSKVAKLTQLNQLPALGEDPCHLSFDKTGKYLFAANYTTGNVAVFPILPDGKLGEHSANVKDAGTLGPNKERQEAPHAHWIQASSDNRFVFVADLGLDAVLTYHFDSSKGALTPNTPFFLRPLSAGEGPRHAAFSPDGQHFYVLSELDSTVTEFAYAPDHGVFGYLGVVPMLPPDFHGRNDAAEIAIHPSGKWLFASNRGHDTIAVFAVDPSSGMLRPAGEFPTGGKEPRHFAIDPTGRFLLAENQNSNSIVVFRIDPANGALSQVSKIDSVPSPVCLAFLSTQ
jgi:6-phosphogluconolactonase